MSTDKPVPAAADEPTPDEPSEAPSPVYEPPVVDKVGGVVELTRGGRSIDTADMRRYYN